MHTVTVAIDLQERSSTVLHQPELLTSLHALAGVTRADHQGNVEQHSTTHPVVL